MAQDQNLKGVAEVVDKLTAMGKMDDGNGLRSATRAAMVPVQKAAVANLLGRSRLTHRRHMLYTKEVVDPGYAEQHIRLVSGLTKDKLAAIASVAPSKKAFYAVQFLELGFSEHGTRHMAASPWLRPAFYQHQNDIKQNLKDKLFAFLQKFEKQAAG